MYIKNMAIVVLVFLCIMGSQLHALQTDIHGMHAVPVPGTITIDGKLNDWDLSGQMLMCYDVHTLVDVYSAKVAFMYDADNLYISISWKDRAPLGNIHDPLYSASEGWAGDSVQLRIRTDRISHVTAWYYEPKQVPFIHIAYGQSDSNPFGGGEVKLSQTKGWKLSQDAEMAFAKDLDGNGYVQEIKLPWKLITKEKKLLPGDQVHCGVELLWGESNWPSHRYADNLAPGRSDREFFFGNVPAWGSLILEKTGKLQLPAPAWEQAAEDERGIGATVIRYTLQENSRVTLAIDDSNGMRVRNLLAAVPRAAGSHEERWDNLDDYGRPVKPGDYHVKAISHDGLHLKYVGSFASPGSPPWANSKGTGAFYGDHSAPQSVASGGDIMALACPVGEAGNPIIAVDMNGQRIWGLGHRITSSHCRMTTDGKTLWVLNGSGKRMIVWRCDLKTGKYTPWNRKDERGDPVLDLVLPVTNSETPTAIANDAGLVAIVLSNERKLIVVNGDSGDVVSQISDLPVGVTAIAYGNNGQLFLSAGSFIYTIPKSMQGILPFASEIIEPMGLACDPDGNIYVSQRGSAQNVAVFNNVGKRIGQIGKTGGRPETGFFDSLGMRNPCSIAIDGQGRLWVAEETLHPKRTSVWTADGKLAFDLVGTTGYAAGGILNPKDVSRGFSELVEYKIDYASGTFKPLFTLQSILGPGRLLKECKIVHIQGREYVQTKGDADISAWMQLFRRNVDDSWTQVMAVGSNPGQRSGFIWTDNNDDRHVQPDEKQIIEGEVGSYYWAQSVGDDLSVAITVDKKHILAFPLDKIDTNGIPHYRLSDRIDITSQSEFASEGMMAVGRDGRIYVNQNPLASYDRSGRCLWTYPNQWIGVHGSHQAPAAGPGLLIGPSSIYGTAFVNDEIGEVLYLNGNLGQNFIFTEDGLWVQSLYNDTRGWFDVPDVATPGMFCDAMTAGGESFFGGFCRGNDGKYYTVGGGTAAVVMEVTGLDSLRRFGLSIHVSADDIELSRQMLQDRKSTQKQQSVYTVKAIAHTPDMTAALNGWNIEQDAIEVKSGRTVVGRFKMTYDAENLYLAYKVKDSTPLKNVGQDASTMFITGDCVDLMLRTDAQAKNSEPVAGDLRMLMTIRDGKPMAWLYQPIVPGTPESQRVAFSSPWRTIHMDKAAAAPVGLTMDRVDDGYVVTAVVPLKVLGVTQLKGQKLRGDVGILLSDSAGQETTARLYWSNSKTNNTNDIPDEVMLSPGNWGEFLFE